MNGKELFAEVCKNNGLICKDIFILGVGSTIGDRCRYDISSHTRKESELYAVKYFETEEIFIAWYLKSFKLPNRTKFSLNSKGLRSISADKVHLIEKNLGFSGHGTETVYVFKSAMIDTFIKQYVIADKK